MTILKEINNWTIQEELWNGGLDTFEAVVENGKTSELIELLEELFPEGADITTVNDLLWFEPEFIFEQLDIEWADG